MAKPEVNTKLEEYKALRQEVLTSITATLTVVGFLLAALAGLAAAGVKSDNPTSAGIFILLIPAVSLFGLQVWLGEVYRLRRASFYLNCLEDNLGLKWESWLRGTPKDREHPRIFVHNHWATYFFFAAAAGVSYFYGLWSVPWCVILPGSVQWSAVVLGLGTVSGAVFLIFVVWRNSKPLRGLDIKSEQVTFGDCPSYEPERSVQT